MAREYIMADHKTAADMTASGVGKTFRWFLFFASLVLGAELIWFLGISPFRPFRKIEVNGFSYFDRDSILKYAGINSESSFISVNSRELERLIGALPQIESVRVFKRFPGKLEISLQGRRAAVMTMTMLGGRTVPVLLDRQGVVFQVGSGSSPDLLLDLPIISGLITEPVFLGMRLPARFISFLEDLDAIRLNAPELLSAVSEIKINRQSPEGLDMILYPLHSKIRIRLSGINEDILRYALLVVDVLADREGGIDIIDFRSGMASYYQKEVPSEQ